MARSRNIGNKALAARERGGVPMPMRARPAPRSTRFNADAFDGGRPVGLWQLLARPSALFCVSLCAFLIVSGIKLWESGLLDPIFGPRGAGPIERGPIRFAPHERAAAKPYTAEPAPESKPAAAPDDATADSDQQ